MLFRSADIKKDEGKADNEVTQIGERGAQATEDPGASNLLRAAVERGIAQTAQVRENPLASTVAAGRRGRPRKIREPEEAQEAQ